MRFGTLAVVASAIAHVGLMAVLASVDAPEHPPVPPRSAAVVVLDRPPPSVPIDIALVSLPAPTAPAAVATAVAPPSTPTVPHSRATAPAIRTVPTSTIEPGGELAPGTAAPIGSDVGPGGDVGPGPSIFDMRRAPTVDLSPRAVAERANIDGGAPPPPRPKPTGELKPSGGGTYESHEPGFTAKVGRDGKVTFKDTPSFSYHFPILDIAPSLPKIVGRHLESWYNDPWKAVRDARRDPNQKEPMDLPGPQRPEDSDIEEVIVPIIGGTADATDAIMRANGIDPYAAAKKAYLERTRAERMELRAADTTRQLKATTDTVRTHLKRVWGRGELTAAARRAAIFELWDDAAEDGPPELVAAGDAARRAVIGFVRSYLPAGSPDAFTDAELAAMNARKLSKQAFAPY